MDNKLLNQNDALNSNKKPEHKEKKKKKHHIDESIQPEKEIPSTNYWNSVADDVATGYKSKEDKSRILNEDQLPGDNERGDEGPKQ